MSSLSRTAGELYIDHRASPGTREVPEGKIFEGATYTCCHCQFVVIIEPRRTRERSVCIKCMAVQCDACAVLGTCVPFLAPFMDKPDVILSVAGAPARVTPSLSGLMLPGHITQ